MAYKQTLIVLADSDNNYYKKKQKKNLIEKSLPAMRLVSIRLTLRT